MKRWSYCLLAIAVTGALVVVFGPCALGPAEPHSIPAIETMLPPFAETMALRLVAKRLVAREAAAGRWSLIEAAALFAALNRVPPETTVLTAPNVPGHPLPHLTGRTDAELLCLSVIAHAAFPRPDEPPDRARAAAARLTAEYLRELRERGSIQLPDPAGLPMAEELLEQARLKMTDLERKSFYSPGPGAGER
jgi:hypothetical protein